MIIWFYDLSKYFSVWYNAFAANLTWAGVKIPLSTDPGLELGDKMAFVVTFPSKWSKWKCSVMSATACQQCNYFHGGKMPFSFPPGLRSSFDKEG